MGGSSRIKIKTSQAQKNQVHASLLTYPQIKYAKQFIQLKQLYMQSAESPTVTFSLHPSHFNKEQMLIGGM